MKKYNDQTLAEKIQQQIDAAEADEQRPEAYVLQLVRDELRELLWNAQYRADALGLTLTLRDFEGQLEQFAEEVGDAGIAYTA